LTVKTNFRVFKNDDICIKNKTTQSKAMDKNIFLKGSVKFYAE